MIACVIFGAFGCTTGDTDIDGSAPAEPAVHVSADQTFKRATAAHLADVLTDETTREQLVGELRQRGPLASTELAALIGELDGDAGEGAAPEIWLHEPEGVSDSSDLLIAYAPTGNKHTWAEIPAYTLGGTRVTLDPQHEPDVPVLVIETHGRLAMHQGVEQANRLLQRAGLQRVPSEIEPFAVAGGIQTTRLDSIHLVNDEEPWILGAAEIYAIVSGVIGSNDPQLQLVDLPYLDKSGVTYTPNQIIVSWSNYAYQITNIQLFEHDNNTSYKDLITAIIGAVGVAGNLAGVPTIQAITEIANRILAAIPASAFTNKDDYVDSFYTIQENSTYTGYQGAAKNATVSLTPFFVPPTDVPPTDVPPTRVPPTRVPPTGVPPTRVPPTRVPPTRIPPARIPPASVPAN